MKTKYRIELLGGIQVVRYESVMARLPPQKMSLLLARLAYPPLHEHSRDELMELLWPEVEPSAGRNRLKQLLFALRDVLTSGDKDAATLIEADRHTLRLNAHHVTTDIAHFQNSLKAASISASYEERVSWLWEAVAVYTAPLLTGHYEDWILIERDCLAETYINAVLQLVSLQGQGESASPEDHNSLLLHLRRATNADPLREELQAALIGFYLQQGRFSEALRQYQRLEQQLAQDLDVRPSEEIQSLYRLIQEQRHPLPAIPSIKPKRIALESVTGAVPLPSYFYVVRPTDNQFQEALTNHDSIVLVKGPRQIGKTSLLARGLQQARDEGCRVVFTDLQKLSGEQMASPESFFQTLAHMITDQLNLESPSGIDPHEARGRAWNLKFERFLRRCVLPAGKEPLVWGLDEVDRLFTVPFGQDVFALFRSWHNERSLDPTGPWGQLTLAMAHATEAHLFITDLNQSPFNVGTRLTMEDFTPQQIAGLNRRYDSPLKDTDEIDRFCNLLGGHPYLVRRGLHEMTAQGITINEFTTLALQDTGPYRNHLERLWFLLSRESDLCASVLAALEGRSAPLEGVYRLTSAGVFDAGSSLEHPKLRCGLYRHFLSMRLTSVFVKDS